MKVDFLSPEMNMGFSIMLRSNQNTRVGAGLFAKHSGNRFKDFPHLASDTSHITGLKSAPFLYFFITDKSAYAHLDLTKPNYLCALRVN